MSRQKVQYGTSSDYSEGLMGEIQRLIAPPNEEYKKKPPNPFKRAGRQNHDTCDACSEPGNLICCDYCTASFHLTCHDPPLEETDIPMGLWLCHTCTIKEKIAKEKEKEELEKASKQPEETPSVDNPLPENLTIPPDVELKDMIVKLETNEPMLIDDEASKKSEDATKEEPEKVEEMEEISPFEELVRVAGLLNPKQFELPVEMTETFPFPGSERVEPIKNGRRVKNKRIIELDSYGCVPLPAKICFSCNKSCKRAPLISCDYCSLYFHQDCLDPPMTALPAGRWMCPNHPQHFIDWNLVSSISATERMKVWDEFGTETVDHETVKLQFFRKVHMKNPPFRTKLKAKARDEVEIPEIIRYQYENPPRLLPSLKDVVRVDNLRKRGTVQVDVPKFEVKQADEDLEAMESARKRLKTIFSDQDDVHGLLVEPETEGREEEVSEKLNKSKDSSRRSKRSKSLGKDQDISIEEIKVENEEKPEISELSSVLPTETEIKEEVQESQPEKPSILNSQELHAINEQLCNLDPETIKLLAFQRLQQIVNENPNYIQKFQDKETASTTVTEIAKWDVHRFPIPLPDEVKSEEKFVPRLRDRAFHMRSESEKAHSVALSMEKTIKKSRVRSRAVLTFANDYLSGRVWFSVTPSFDLSVSMRYRSFSIGSGAENDLDLSRFGMCAHASPKHAVIFFDDVTKQFELLNYSEFGTEVNGQFFCCDFTEYPNNVCEAPASPLKEKRVAIQSKIKNMLDAKKKIREGIEKAEAEVIMAAEDAPICDCKGRCPMISGWEGTALLQHGYLLKFGCLSFVFSIAEYDSGNDSEF